MNQNRKNTKKLIIVLFIPRNVLFIIYKFNYLFIHLYFDNKIKYKNYIKDIPNKLIFVYFYFFKNKTKKIKNGVSETKINFSSSSFLFFCFF